MQPVDLDRLDRGEPEAAEVEHAGIEMGDDQDVSDDDFDASQEDEREEFRAIIAHRACRTPQLSALVRVLRGR